jgi:hypothetical protein
MNNLKLEMNGNIIEKIINPIGVIFNGICIVVFSLIIKRTLSNSQSNMFKYLLIKSALDCVYCLSELFYHFGICQISAIQYLTCSIVNVWIYNYCEFICKALSILFEIAATLDCYLNITKKVRCCQTNLFFYSFLICATILTSLFYLIFPLTTNIVDISKIELNISNNNQSYFNHQLETSHFSIILNNNDKLIRFYNSLIRDCLMFIILVVLNVMILSLLIQTTKRRRTLGSNNDNLLTLAQRAERKKMIMIISTGLNYMIGHFLLLVDLLIESYFGYEKNYFYVIATLIFKISYVDSLLFYLFFNNIFKSVLIGFIPFVINRNI